jgi:hypothetical protein
VPRRAPNFKRATGSCARLMVVSQGWSMDLLARLIVDEVHLSPFPSLALVHQVHRRHLVASLLLFPCFLFLAALSLAASSRARALRAQGQNS